MNFAELIIRNKPLRVWRIRGALYAALWQGHSTGYALQILAGQIINLALVFRGYMSILSHTFRFITSHVDVVGV